MKYDYNRQQTASLGKFGWGKLPSGGYEATGWLRGRASIEKIGRAWVLKLDGATYEMPRRGASFGHAEGVIKEKLGSTYDRRTAAREKRALRQRTLTFLMNKGQQFGVMSAYGTGSKQESKGQHGQLMADLQRAGIRKIKTIRGQWDGVSEKSILIPSINYGLLFQLGRKYDQDAVIYKSADGVIGLYNYRTKTVEIAIDENNDPAFKISQDPDLFSRIRKNWSFEFGFVFGRKIAWDGRTPVSLKQVKEFFN